MEPLIGNEYCCAISPPAAPDFCLHIALFYRRCRRSRPHAALPGLSPPPPPPSPQPNRPPSPHRYTVFRLLYGPEARPQHRLFVQTAVAGPVRGLYLYLDDVSSRYSESPGDDPLLYHPSSSSFHALRAKTLVGTVAPHNFDRFRHLCRRLTPPDAARRPLSAVQRFSHDWIQESIARGVADGILDVGLRPHTA
ncbi:hypothetical protein XA68_16484 [Ophiocordyceps unilateralis]|uniref:Uncharacterized protein n=1 Tax=Ophiocordyceps unilateralis TaxID=268505 RepID=A0A2A9P5I5_OPHUN|nr:hypothetical protein XA68_16484 [Ophiocordyceps unilateralis]